MQNPTPTSVVVLWTANTPNKGVVEYGTSAKVLDQSLVAPEEEWSKPHGNHELTLTNLEPGQEYYYRVVSTPVDGRSAVASEIASFVTP